MEKYILSGDFGKYETEVLGRNIKGSAEEVKLVRFRTKMYNIEDGFIEVEGNSHLVEMEGKQFIIGEQGQEKSNNTSKTSELHKLACYTAITQFIEPGTKGNEIYMVLACPLSVLTIKEAKEEYKKFLQGNGLIQINVDNKAYEFEIKEIMIKAEGSGILYLEPERFINKTVGLIDLGGLNMGWSLYNNKVCKKEDRFIEECGTDRLLDITREQLSIYKKGNLINKEIAEKALEEGGMKKSGKLDEGSKQYIEKAKKIYLNEVQKHIEGHKFSIDDLDEIIFVGGTSQHIKNEIDNSINHSYVPEKSQLSTVEGLYKVAYNKYSKMELI